MFDNNTAEEQLADTPEDGLITPLVDVVEDSSGITLHADLPGVPKGKL